MLRCGLDAACFYVYLPAEANDDWLSAEGEMAEDLARLKTSFPTPRDAVAYIMDTFPMVNRKDEEKRGEYRTKRVILETYSSMAESTCSGQQYQTCLNPPAGPPGGGLPDWPPGTPRPSTWPPHILPSSAGESMANQIPLTERLPCLRCERIMSTPSPHTPSGPNL